MHEKNSSKGQPLLPLNALRAFEAIARHMSFARAAEELHVTPAALSHQIRGLEEQLGLPLFTRRTRAIELTEAGRLIYPGLRLTAPQSRKICSKPSCSATNAGPSPARSNRTSARSSWPRPGA